MRARTCGGVRPSQHPEWTWGIAPFDRVTGRCPTFRLSADDIADIARARYHRSIWSADTTSDRSARIGPQPVPSPAMSFSIEPTAGSPTTVGILGHSRSTLCLIPTL